MGTKKKSICSVPNAFDALLKSMPKEELDRIFDSVQASNAGQTLEEYRACSALNMELHEEGDKYRGLPASEWPELNFCWDFSREGQRFAFDGRDSQHFSSMYPSGLVLGYAQLLVFDKHLAHFSRRDTPSELWGLGCQYKLAKTIAYIRRGYPITPPVVSAVKGEVFLKGGNHRYAIAKCAKLETIPFLVMPEEVPEIEEIFSLSWGMPS